MYNELKRTLLVCAIAAISFSAQAAVIGFDALEPTAHRSIVHFEDGFMVVPAGGEAWSDHHRVRRPRLSIGHTRSPTSLTWAVMLVRDLEFAPFIFSRSIFTRASPRFPTVSLAFATT